MKTNVTEDEQSKLLEQLKNEPEFVTVKDLISKIDPSMSPKKVGKWLAQANNVESVKKYGLNRYKFRPEKSGLTHSNEQSMLHAVLTEVRNAGVDIDKIIQGIREKKIRELEMLKQI